jgi:hypothetical protein
LVKGHEHFAPKATTQDDWYNVVVVVVVILIIACVYFDGRE